MIRGVVRSMMATSSSSAVTFWGCEGEESRWAQALAAPRNTCEAKPYLGGDGHRQPALGDPSPGGSHERSSPWAGDGLQDNRFISQSELSIGCEHPHNIG